MAELINLPGIMSVFSVNDGLELELDGYWGVQEVIPDLADEGKTSITLVRIDKD